VSTLSEMQGHSEKCRCCGASNWQKIEEDRPYSWQECQQCGVFFNHHEVNPPPGKLLDNEINTDWDLLRRDIEKFVPILDAIERHTEKGFLYDIGCSSGYLVWLAVLRGWRAARGLDIDKGALRAAKKMFDTDIDLGQFEDGWMSPKIKVNAFVFHHGIEHVANPKACIEQCIAHLAPGGIIYLAHPMMPGRESVAEMGNAAHQHEWTYVAFHWFLGQFSMSLAPVMGSAGINVGSGVPGQTWMVRKRDVE